VRKELGGYYPKELEKRYFYQQLFMNILKEEKRKEALNKVKHLARRGGN